MTGKFIVLYGINNLGKSTQAKMLVDRLNAEGKKAVYWKYPRYDVAPAGPLINDYLRGGNPYNFTPREIQLLHYADRLKVEPELKEMLTDGTHVIAEDYFGTAVAWGAGAGVEMDLLKKLYATLHKEDLAILFDGERFTEAVEKNHKHETDNDLTNKVREAHMHIGAKFGWQTVNANQPIETIHNWLWEQVRTVIS